MRSLLMPALIFTLALAGPARADPAAEGKVLFEQKCASCHTIGGGDRIGPDLHGVAERRPQEWLLRFVTEPDKMIAAKDEVAVRLYEKYNRIIMPNLGLAENDARALLAHIQAASSATPPAAAAPPTPLRMPRPQLIAPQSTILVAFLALAAVIIAVFAWVALSTRSPAEVDVKKAYGVRKIFFVTASVVLVALLIATLPRAPYAGADVKPDRIVHVAARQFDFVFSDEPIVSASDLGRVPTIQRLELKAGALVEFRVTALDVNHGFGLYGPQRQLLAQTQAMPGYVNRLVVRLAEPGQYKVFCLEYCAAGHHLMQSGVTVN
ncbi:MAG: c-type cytochrome [Burkholderiales bacterium]|nr:c-type cytochrome [Burkholderiales bacterium]